eukprot:scpid51032/ scgid1531/ 
MVGSNIDSGCGARSYGNREVGTSAAALPRMCERPMPTNASAPDVHEAHSVVQHLVRPSYTQRTSDRCQSIDREAGVDAPDPGRCTCRNGDERRRMSYDSGSGSLCYHQRMKALPALQLLLLLLLLAERSSLIEADGTPAAIECRAPTSLATVHCPAAVPNANDVREWRRTDTSASTSWITPFSRDDGVYAHESTMVIDSVAHRHAGEYEAWSYRQPGVKAKLICRVYLIVAEYGSCQEHIKLKMLGPKSATTLVGRRACIHFRPAITIDKRIAVRGIPTPMDVFYKKITKDEMLSLETWGSGRYSVENGSHLCIEDARLDDVAKYTSTGALSEQFGFTKEFTTRLKVRMPATLDVSLLPITVTPTRHISVDCAAQGNPLPTVAWYKLSDTSNARTLLSKTSRRLRAQPAVTRPQSGVKITSSAERKNYRVITSLVLSGPSAAGTYLCEARNTGFYGRTHTSQPVNITESVF